MNCGIRETNNNTTDDRVTINSNSTSGILDYFVPKGSSIQVNIEKLRFGKKDNGDYIKCDYKEPKPIIPRNGLSGPRG